MKFVTEKNGILFFKSENCEFNRPRLTSLNRTLRCVAWMNDRTLFALTDSDKEQFPTAEFRLEVGGNHDQKDPMFMAVPARMKPNRKTILQLFVNPNETYEIRVKESHDYS